MNTLLLASQMDRTHLGVSSRCGYATNTKSKCKRVDMSASTPMQNLKIINMTCSVCGWYSSGPEEAVHALYNNHLAECIKRILFIGAGMVIGGMIGKTSWSTPKFEVIKPAHDWKKSATRDSAPSRLLDISAPREPVSYCHEQFMNFIERRYTKSFSEMEETPTIALFAHFTNRKRVAV